MWPPADPEPAGAPDGPQTQSLRTLLPTREFLCSRKGRLLLGESALSFIIFICYIVSAAAPFLTVPLLMLLLALCFLFGYFMKINEKFPGMCWPLSDVLRCVTAIILYLVISITAISKYSDGAAKTAGVFGFIAAIVYVLDLYIIFNDLAKLLKQGNAANDTAAEKSEEEDSNSDSD
ncbi:CKLF-like MARVEL transmembrane domain-containing protein 3 isoform X2 [Trichosurus vulpecula]|uniref:CKLF-like MARVEL transmembrane domain-containing protein 3 isoform X2 n=1 Tax=Trichosurus vulpecula TaxID=9337 RepID=UPI00186ADB37|nr:CKLF-like MARVEL transmembrane domain-containing protein 3 isoform X2 [Trichosurus vulpecula]